MQSHGLKARGTPDAAISGMGDTMKNLIFGLVLGLGVLGNGVAFAACDVISDMQIFRAQAQEAQMLALSLHREVDKCFNPYNKQYSEAVKKGLQKMAVAFERAQVESAIAYNKANAASSRAATKPVNRMKGAANQENALRFSGERNAEVNAALQEFQIAVRNLRANLAPPTGELLQRESRLTSDGFTTSDKKKDDGQWKYPECNSQVNQSPEKQWRRFLGLVKQNIPVNLAKLETSVGCQKSAIAIEGETNIVWAESLEGVL